MIAKKRSLLAVLFAIILTFTLASSAFASNGTTIISPVGTDTNPGSVSTQYALGVLWNQNSNVTHFSVSISDGLNSYYNTSFIPQTVPPGSIVGNHTIPQSVMASLTPGKKYYVAVITQVANATGGFDPDKMGMDHVWFIAQ